jgi:hypothetical protein
MEAVRTDRKMAPLMLLQETFLFIIQHPEYTPQTPRYAVINPHQKKLSQSPERLA